MPPPADSAPTPSAGGAPPVLALADAAAWLLLLGGLTALGLWLRPHTAPGAAFAAWTAAFASLAWLVPRGLALPWRERAAAPPAATGHPPANTDTTAPPTAPARVASRLSLAGVLLLGVLLRLCFLPYPISDDVHRYAWEGRLQSQGANPYLVAPAERPDAEDPIWRGINQPDLPAAYPPVIQLVHRGLAAIAYRPGDPPQRVYTVFKLAALLADIATLLLLAALLRATGRPVAWLALYACNPLVLVVGVGEAHLDVYQGLLLTAALFALLVRPVRPWLAWPLLGATVLVKYFAVILAPFFLRRDSWRWAPLALLPGLAFLPFYDPAMFGSLLAFGRDFHHGDLLPRLIRSVGLAPSLAQLLPPLLLAAALLAIALWHFLLATTRSPAPAMALAWIALLVCLPTVHPWYFLPLMALWTLAPWPGIGLLALGQGLGFWVLHRQHATGQWSETPGIWALAWLPGLALLLWQATRHRTAPAPLAASSPRPLPLPLPALPAEPLISIIIPSYRRDPDELEAFLTELLQLPGHYEVLLSDLGTPGCAERLAAAVAASRFSGRAELIAHPGRETLPRYTSMNLAARQARGDILFFVHSDIRLPATAITQVQTSIASGAVAGGFLKRYDVAPLPLRLFGTVLDLRTRRRKRMVGTNCLFLRADVFRGLGGYVEHFLEDVVLVDTLLAHYGPARITVVPDRVEVSSIKYLRDGILKSIIFNYFIVRAWDRREASPEQLETLYRTKGRRPLRELLHELRTCRDARATPRDDQP